MNYSFKNEDKFVSHPVYEKTGTYWRFTVDTETEPEFRLRDCDVVQVFICFSDFHRVEQEWISILLELYNSTDLIRCITKLVFPDKRNSNDRSGQIEENASDIQFLMQAFTGIEDRLSKIEASTGDRGIDPKCFTR